MARRSSSTALVEYYRAFAEPRALEQAADLFRLLEAHCHDAEFAGYFETLSCDWQPCEDVRLSEKDMNEKKSMNNHLHLLEARASLVAAWPEPPAARRPRADRSVRAVHPQCRRNAFPPFLRRGVESPIGDLYLWARY